MKIGYIYVTTNLINGKQYIGKCTSSIFVENYFGSGIILNRALKKYKKENFSINILFWAKDELELNIMEREYILEYSKNNNLYNLAEGGDGGNTIKYHSFEEQKLIIEKRAQSLKQWHKKMSKEEKELWASSISNAKKGKVPNRLDYKHSESTRKKISESNKKAHLNRPASWIENHNAAAKKRRGLLTWNAQAIEINNKIYMSLSAASLETGLSRYKIKKLIDLGDAKYVSK